MHKILIISFKHLGDQVTTSSVLPLIREAWPEAEIHYLINPGGVDLAIHHPLVAKVFSARRHQGFLETWKLWRKLRKENYDLALDYSEGDRGAFWALASGAPVRVGYLGKPSYFFRNWSYTRGLPNREFAVLDKHITECHAEAMTLLGYKPKSVPNPEVYFSEVGAREAEGFLSKHGVGDGRPFCLVHFTSREKIRQWPWHYCLIALNWLSDNVGPVVITAWNDPEEMKFVESLIKNSHGLVINSAGELSLDALMALISKARICMGGDSLMGHLAGALGRPMLSVFGPYSDVHWAPRGRWVRVVKTDKTCHPCVRGDVPPEKRGGCRPHGMSGCLEDLDFDTQVLPVLEKLLSDTANID